MYSLRTMMKKLCKSIQLLAVKFCQFTPWQTFRWFVSCTLCGVGGVIALYYTSTPFCYEARFGTGSISVLPGLLSPHNLSTIHLPGNMSLISIELPSIHAYEVCLDERAFSGDPFPQCLMFPISIVFCRPEDGTSSYCLPPSLVKRTSGTPIIGFSMIETTSNIAFYTFMSPNPVKGRIVLSETSSLEAVWYEFLGCNWHRAFFAVYLVPGVATFLALFVCCCCKRSRQKYKVNNTRASVEDGLLKRTEAVQRDETSATFENPNTGVERQSIEVEVEVHDQQHSGEVGVQRRLAPENDGETGFSAFDRWEPETNTTGTSRMILPHPTNLQSRDPSLYGSTSSAGSNGSALHSDVSSLSSRFSAIEDTTTNVQPPPFVRPVRSVFDIFSQQERENPDGGNA